MLFTRTETILNGFLSHQTFANGYIFQGIDGANHDWAAHYFATAIRAGQQTLPMITPQVLSDEGWAGLSTVDLIHFSVEGRLLIEHVRQLQEQIKYGPSQHTYMCVIIHNAHSLTIGAANALLKSLEEPPAGVIFIFLTDNPLRLLSTIRSRSQLVDFPSRSDKMIASPSLSFTALQSTPLHQLAFEAEKMAKDKENLQPTLLAWCQEIKTLSIPLESKNHYSKEIISTLDALQFNVNLRLRLENLFLKINSNHLANLTDIN